MKWVRWAAVAGVVVLGVAALGVATQPTDTPIPADGVSVASSKPLPPARPAPVREGARGPNGRPIEVEPGREYKREGLPERPAPQGPADAAMWDEVRRNASSEWARKTINAVQSYGKDLPEERQVVLLSNIAAFTSEVEAIREAIRTGDIPPAEGRALVVESRNRVAEAMRDELGEDASVLQEALQAESPGGGW